MHAHASLQHLLIATTTTNKLNRNEMDAKSCSGSCQSQHISKTVEIILVLIAFLIVFAIVIIVVSRYYSRKSQIIKTQKQVQLFDELMRKTKEKHKIMQQLRGQQKYNETSIEIESPVKSRESFKRIIPNTEIHQSTDEYGRNIIRIQIPRSILYEDAIEIKKFDESDEEEDECPDIRNEFDEHLNEQTLDSIHK
uniref:Uncharacterized protein n=1 Tax=Setaria digitata TaxID=48799 RepID=A0A915Q4J1_9BILA